MLWLLLFLLLSALGVLWWRFAMPTGAGAAVAPPVLNGNHPSLRTRHYRLADFYPAPVVVPPAPEPTPDPEQPALSPEEAPVAETAPTESEDPSTQASEAGQLPEGARHNYLTAPAPTATDEHNRGVELTAAERRAKMRALMGTALENRRAAPASA
ncbi:hypothetical protein J0X19_21020 [Hymenobacter sp. BT186]|uniref:Uncharacterized protein n=1 Tax=Hymenobacter telluris TaxID=2816474 RepID=A0A939F177_9BACT|nr:hypothetical protein [Hymenobacter telluris]MBO0360457.1 hypothetical protein [Hymenobacter telluris]MBW3376484.1 hypothetical protein [Hymenobacter norwichensis]